MTKTEIEAIKLVIERLRGERGGSKELRAVLSDSYITCYLETWVIGPLELLLPGPERNPRLAKEAAK